MRLRLPATIRAGVARSRRLAATTPGVLAAIAAAAVVLCLTCGLVCANQLSAKTARRDEALTRSEPLDNAARSLYVALAQADASAATAFLSGGVESPQARSQYRRALADAATALATATTGTGDPHSRRIVADVSTNLPVYAGLVESARVGGRQGSPVGSAYLREASGLMQKSLLRSADRLTTERSAAVRADQRAIAGPPWLAIVLLLAVLAGAVVASRILLRRTNRLFNLGIVAAASATLVALVWIVVATITSAAAVDTGAGDPATRSENLSQARILGQRARTDELLELVTRGDTTAAEADFTHETNQLRTRLNGVEPVKSPVLQQFSQWLTAHGKQVGYDDAANYPAAVNQAVGTGPADSATIFTALDGSLRADLAHTRAQVRDRIASAGDSWIASAAGVLVLLIFAACAAVAGLWPRLREFR